MASFKRARLFVNENFASEDVYIRDEVWVAKLVKSENDYQIFKYRIRYYRSNNPMAFGFMGEDDDQYQQVSAAIEEMGPAISCYLEIWNGNSWGKCLDWLGEPTDSVEKAFDDLNNQFRSFITCVPLDASEPSSFVPPTKKDPKVIKPKKDFLSSKINKAAVKVDLDKLLKPEPNDIEDILKPNTKIDNDPDPDPDSDDDEDFWI